MRKLILITALVIAIMTGSGLAYAASTKTPVGEYPNGTVLACVQTASPYTLKAHAGKSATACPKGTEKIVLEKPRTTPAAGPRGATGPAGPKGDTGAAAPAPAYGVAMVNVARGGAPASTWATYSTALGSPVGDTASGAFRFTCSETKAPCVVSAQAYATAVGVSVYPRLILTRQGLSNESSTNCEYADGTDNDGGSKTVGTSATALQLGVGSSQSCGDQASATADASVGSISVPSGYYDVAATFTFSR